MPTLYALLVGINDYPDPRHVLRGCVNDVQHLHAYLETYCERMGIAYRPLILTDAAATRQAVIDGFEHFAAALPTDGCLFHFSGHGSRCPAPEAFWELEPDHCLESMVCWDSRTPGGYDLMDKELSYLIWRATQERERPLLTIMDCCHSGRMRAINEPVTGIRALREGGGALPAAQFLGLEHYKKTEAGQLHPPLGRRVHLAAARDVELAKEVLAKGQPRGIFTYCLIETLEATGPLISYADLLHRVNLRIRNAVADQSAQLEATFPEDRNRGFLFSRLETDRPSYLVAWDKTLGWVLRAGALHGIPASEGDARTLLELTEDGHQVTVETVLADCSKVQGMEGYDTKRAYAVVVRRWARPRLRLAFAPGSEPEGMDLLINLIQRQASDLFCIGQEGDGEDYLVHAREATYFLSRTHNPAPLFLTIPGYNAAAAATFLQQLEQVANWQQLLELQHPDASLREEEVAIELYRSTEPGNEADTVATEPVDRHSFPAVYRYAYSNGQWRRPAFQLKLRNTGYRPLWVSLLYLGSDFSITNALLPRQELLPGQEVWATDVFQGYQYRTIPLQIEKEGVAGIDEYLQLLICTEELNTDYLCQKGIVADSAPLRQIGRREVPASKDWAARTIGLRIERHFDLH